MNKLSSNWNRDLDFLGDKDSKEHILHKYRPHSKSSDREIDSNMTPDEVSDVISDRLIKVIEEDSSQRKENSSK